MPRTNQIIPKYDVPHVMTVINDNSVVSPITNVTVPDPAVRALCIVNTAKGPDGVKTVRSTYDYINTYGQPDMKKYGQASYMPYLLLNSGNAVVHCLRVTAPDAAYANIVVTATIATTEGGGTTVTFATESIPNLTNLSEFGGAIKALSTDTKFALMGFATTGRGSYGNNVAFRLVNATSATINTGFKNYTIDVLDKDGGLSVKGKYTGAIYPFAISSNLTKYISDIINDPETGSSYVTTYVNEDALDAIYDAYVSTVTTGGSPVPLSEFDVFFGSYDATGAATTSPDATFKVVTVDDGGVNFETTTGLVFSNGSDGDFANADETVRQKAIETEYLKAISVLSDSEYATTFSEARRYGRLAMSKRRTPADIILDANFSVDIKKALYALALKRGDAMLYLDSTTKHNSVSSLIAWDNENFRSDGSSFFASSDEDTMDFVVSREAQWYKTRDPFTGKIIDVTYTWFLASALPTHIIANGNQVPFIGERYAPLTGAITNSVQPNVDADDLDTKQLLWERKINTIDSLSENTYVRTTQVTVQTDVSDLSEGNNVLVLLEMKRMIEDLTLSRLYDFSDAEDRVKFTEDAQRLFATYPNRKVRSFRVYFAMNEYEQDRNILHCYLETVFRQIATRGIVEIDINKRT